MRTPEQTREAIVQKFVSRTLPFTDAANIAILGAVRQIAEARHGGDTEEAFQSIRAEVQRRAGTDIIGNDMKTWRTISGSMRLDHTNAA